LSLRWHRIAWSADLGSSSSAKPFGFGASLRRLCRHLPELRSKAIRSVTDTTHVGIVHAGGEVVGLWMYRLRHAKEDW